MVPLEAKQKTTRYYYSVINEDDRKLEELGLEIDDAMTEYSQENHLRKDRYTNGW